MELVATLVMVRSFPENGIDRHFWDVAPKGQKRISFLVGTKFLTTQRSALRSLART